MCGIAGVVYADPFRSAEPQTLQRMGDAIAHRGPDGEGFYRGQNVGLVHRRLAVIDLNGGNQPIANEDESIQVVFNGEIYNHRELRSQLESKGHRFRTDSDTEVLVHLYEEFGADLVKQLRGMFAFALWDISKRSLVLGRDHFGQKPLYIYRDHEKLVFGSELKAILSHPNVDRTIAPEAVEDYLTFGVIPGERSIFRRVQRLPPAHTLCVTAETLNAAPQRYWRLSFRESEQRTTADWKEAVAQELRSSVKAHLIADVPVGAFLSGGLDSSAIVASLSEISSEPVRTFSIGFNEKQFSELPHADAVARRFGTQHHEEVVTPVAVRDLDEFIHYYDEPFADASAIPMMTVARMAAKHVKVVLSGDGGDEAFGGYRRYGHDLQEAAIRDLLPGWLRQSIIRPLSGIWPKADWLPRPLRLKTVLQNLSSDPATAYANTISLCRTEVRKQLMNPAFANSVAGHRPEAFVESGFRSGNRDALSGMLAADTAFLLPDDFLAKVDRASMAYGLEVRTPFIDVRLMELAAGMPSDLKIRNGCRKWILKELFAPRLPAKLAHRSKQGFELPVDTWLRGPLREQVEHVVLRADAPISEYIDTSVASRLFHAHCRRTGQYDEILWSLLVLGRWLDKYVEQQPETYATESKAKVLAAC